MKLVPRDYQQEGIDAFLQNKHYANHDMPGLGKSLQAAEAASKFLPCIIASPVYLTLQWERFLQEQYEGASITLAQGTYAQRTTALSHKSDFYIINHDMFRSYLLPTAQSLILDEAHHLRGRNADRSKAAQRKASTTPYVFQLTATPIHRTVDDLFMQLRILDPQHFTSYYRFLDDYCLVSHRGFTPIVRGVSRPKALARLLDRYRIGRSYSDVGLSVPDVVYHTLTVEFTKPHLKQYRQVRDQYRDDTTNHIYGSAIEKIHALRRLTLCEEKINTVKGLLDDTLVNGEGYLLYCHYIDSAHQWADTLGAICITGETPARERLALAKANRKVVATVGSLAEGGDLTHLKTLVYAEEDYVAGPITQTIGRVVRPTQNMAPVNVYYVMVKGTIDVTIHKCSQARIVDAEQVMEQELL